MKVALVHDYLIEYGGAERVLEALHELYPDAPVYTSFVNEKTLGIHWSRFKDWDIRQTWITNLPFYKKLHSPFRVFAPAAFAALDLSDFDVVISSSNAYYAKAVKVPNGVHICYCHTPPRALYGYATMSDWKQNPFFRFFGTLINHYLRVVDFKVSQQVDYFITNSSETAARIKKFYRRDSTVIYPPVDVPEKLEKKSAETAKDDRYFLYVNRLAFAKHPELAVRVCTEQNWPLVLVGDGKARASLEAEAGASVQFKGAVTDGALHQLYQGAQALLYPVEDEDFGIVPIEAMGHGVPVIAHNSGGPKETIQDGKTGILFNELSVSGLKEAVEKYRKSTFDSKKIFEHALEFRKENFQRNIEKFVEKVVNHKN
jgi:glycosyltransferase involved in cell wall biosynthesis